MHPHSFLFRFCFNCLIVSLNPVQQIKELNRACIIVSFLHYSHNNRQRKGTYPIAVRRPDGTRSGDVPSDVTPRDGCALQQVVFHQQKQRKNQQAQRSVGECSPTHWQLFCVRQQNKNRAGDRNPVQDDRVVPPLVARGVMDGAADACRAEQVYQQL